MARLLLGPLARSPHLTSVTCTSFRIEQKTRGRSPGAGGECQCTTFRSTGLRATRSTPVDPSKARRLVRNISIRHRQLDGTPTHFLDIETIRSVLPSTLAEGEPLSVFNSAATAETARCDLTHHGWLNTTPEDPNAIFLPRCVQR